MALFIFGCGSGKDVNGSLTVVAGGVTASGSLAQAPFTITYTNPQKTDVLGVEINVTSQLDNNASRSFTYSTSNSGVNIFTFSVPQTTSSQNLQVVARTGDIVSSASVSIPAISSTPPTLTASPTSIAFAVAAATGTTQILTLSGGLQPYNFIVSPSPNNDISASINGTIMTVIKTASAATTGTANIVVTDSTTPSPGVVVIPVSF